MRRPDRVPRATASALYRLEEVLRRRKEDVPRNFHCVPTKARGSKPAKPLRTLRYQLSRLHARPAKEHVSGVETGAVAVEDQAPGSLPNVSSAS